MADHAHCVVFQKCNADVIAHKNGLSRLKDVEPKFLMDHVLYSLQWYTYDLSKDENFALSDLKVWLAADMNIFWRDLHF